MLAWVRIRNKMGMKNHEKIICIHTSWKLTKINFTETFSIIFNTRSWKKYVGEIPKIYTLTRRENESFTWIMEINKFKQR